MTDVLNYLLISNQLTNAVAVGLVVFLYIRPILFGLMGYGRTNMKFPWWVRLADETPRQGTLPPCKDCRSSNYSIAILCRECSNFLLGGPRKGLLRWLGISLFRLSFLITGVLIGFYKYTWPGKVILLGFSLIILFMLLRHHIVLFAFLLLATIGIFAAYIWTAWDILVLAIITFFPMFSNWQALKYWTQRPEETNTKAGPVGVTIPATIAALLIAVVALRGLSFFLPIQMSAIDAIAYSNFLFVSLIFAFFSSALVNAICNSLIGGVGIVPPKWNFKKRKPSTAELRVRGVTFDAKGVFERALVSIKLFIIVGKLQLRFLVRTGVFYLQKSLSIVVNVVWVNLVKVARHIKNVISILFDVFVSVMSISFSSVRAYGRSIVLPIIFLLAMGYFSIQFGDDLYSYINVSSISFSTNLTSHVFYLIVFPVLIGLAVLCTCALLLTNWSIVFDVVATALGKFALADGSLCFFFSNLALMAWSYLRGGPYTIGVFTILNAVVLIIAMSTKIDTGQSEVS